MKIIVYHTGYGCDTGCCGHAVETDDGTVYRFRFTHPYGEDHIAFAQNLVRDEMGGEHVADLDWDNCLICEELRAISRSGPRGSAIRAAAPLSPAAATGTVILNDQAAAARGQGIGAVLPHLVAARFPAAPQES